MFPFALMIWHSYMITNTWADFDGVSLEFEDSFILAPQESDINLSKAMLHRQFVSPLSHSSSPMMSCICARLKKFSPFGVYILYLYFSCSSSYSRDSSSYYRDPFFQVRILHMNLTCLIEFISAWFRCLCNLCNQILSMGVQVPTFNVRMNSNGMDNTSSSIGVKLNVTSLNIVGCRYRRPALSCWYVFVWHWTWKSFLPLFFFIFVTLMHLMVHNMTW